MRHAFNGIDNWASEVISWVSLVLSASLVMNLVLAAEEHRVSKTLDLILHVHLGSDTES